MIQSRLAVCAESVVRDAERNNISVFNIFEEFSVAEFPAILAKFSTLFILERTEQDPDRVEAAISITLDAEEIGHASMRGDFEGKLRTRLILVAQGLPVEKPGILTTTLFIN